MKIHESKLKFATGKQKDSHKYLKVFHVFKNSLEPAFKKKFNLQFEGNIFTGDVGQRLDSQNENTLYLGLGEEGKIQIRKIAALYVKLGGEISKWAGVGLEIHLSKKLTSLFSYEELVYNIAVSLEIGAYELDSLSKTFAKKKRDASFVHFVFEDEKFNSKAKKILGKAEVVGRYINETRFIQHLPANYFTPEEFVERAKEIAKEGRLKITVFDEDRLKKEKFGGILAVSQGSPIRPKMIILEYSPKGKMNCPKLAIVGKGLTFDAGGISLKPSADMHEMKYDMSGAATTIHALGAIAKLGIDLSVVAAIGVVENMPDGKAIKPGDVYTAYNGITVEVQNTDAEGRLVLGDVLSYVCEKYNPEYMVDLATLTGAVVVALGSEAAALISNSDDLADKIKKASHISHDRVWEMPFWEEFGEDLKSDIADVRNITGGKGAGTLSATQFLAKFVNPEIRWAHLDIAGTAWRTKASGTQSAGPTGFGVRLLIELAEILSTK